MLWSVATATSTPTAASERMRDSIVVGASNDGIAWTWRSAERNPRVSTTRDGVMKGLNIEATLALAEATSIAVIASGGLASIDDVERLLEPDCARLAGAITGRALYDGRLDAAEALTLIKNRADA